MKAAFMKATAFCVMLTLSGCGHFGGRVAEASAAPQRHPHGGSGIVGSPQLESLTEQWRPMHESAAKGFALFDTKASDFDVVDATPFGRDVIRELEQASSAADLSFGVYYSHSIDWRDVGDGVIPPNGWSIVSVSAEAGFPPALRCLVPRSGLTKG